MRSMHQSFREECGESISHVCDKNISEVTEI